MLAAGAPTAPVMVFLISSPLMSPSAFFITLGGLGLSITIWKLLSAISLGLIAGWVTERLSRRGYLGRSILRVETDPRQQPRTASCSNPEIRQGAPPRRGVDAESVKIFLRQTGKLSLFIGKFVIIAVIAQAIMVRYVPQDWISTVVGIRNSYSVFIATLVGIPSYVSSISAVPLLRGLMDLGMDKGAVLAFIIAGPIMTVPSILAVTALFKRRALYIYVTVGFFGALIFGYTYRLV
jgi:uncharacterized membrane protein YraQ (UPF0718 family)